MQNVTPIKDCTFPEMVLDTTLGCPQVKCHLILQELYSAATWSSVGHVLSTKALKSTMLLNTADHDKKILLSVGNYCEMAVCSCAEETIVAVQ